jgi:hypothetical protein
MSRGNETPGRSAYFDALEKIFTLESQILTAVLPHKGERGRNDEDRARAFFSKVLPRRFSIGTGFILCSNPEFGISGQTDIVIYDEVFNSPVHRELAAFVFPVEMVYGTVEVKGNLDSGDLKPAMEKVAHIRQMARHKVYLVYGNQQVGEPGQSVLQKVEIKGDQSPRAFLFAFDASWASADALADALTNAAVDVPASHLHGIVVVSKSWYLYQVAYSNPPRFKVRTDRALLRFTSGMTHNLSSVAMGAASMDRYMDFDK